MDNNLFFNQVLTSYPKMTRAERKVADLVLKEPNKIIYLTISELAQRCEIGETSVFRFCKTLGLNGYKEFTMALALSTASAEQKDEEILEEDDINEIYKNVHTAYKMSIESVFNNLDFTLITKMATLITNASNIHVYGIGASSTTAFEFVDKFSKIIPRVSHHADNHSQLVDAALLDDKDLCIVFSHSGVTRDCISIAKAAYSNNCPVIFITQQPNTPAKEFCDVLCVCGSSYKPWDGGSIGVKTAQLFLLDILYAAVYDKLGNLSITRKKKIAKVTSKKAILYN